MRVGAQIGGDEARRRVTFKVAPNVAVARNVLNIRASVVVVFDECSAIFF